MKVLDSSVIDIIATGVEKLETLRRDERDQGVPLTIHSRLYAM